VKTKLASIIIVSYNCEDVLDQCLASCADLEEAEVIVVDNNSKDGSVAIMERYKDRIKVLVETENQGFTRACNLAIAQARGKYIFLLNPDAQLMPDTISDLCSILEADEELGAVAPTLVYPDGSFQNYTRRFPTIGALLVASFVPPRFQSKFASYRKYQCEDVSFAVDQYVEQPAGAALLYRAKYRLDESFFVYGSDLALCKDIIDDGLKIKQVTSSKVIHHQSQGGTGNVNTTLRLYLDLDYYYAMAVYMERYETPVKSALFKLLFSLGLTAAAIMALPKGGQNAKLKFQRVLYFVQGKNLRHLVKK
jgi:GT2 family glycosyltransferase